MMSLSGGKLAGGNPTNKRVDNDFYAINPEAVEMLFEKESFEGNFLEPCVGQGHIADVVKKHFPYSVVYCSDLVDRGYENTIIADFLTYDFSNLEGKINNIITNPPFFLAQEFLEKSMDIIEDGGKVALFLKIQFLEGAKREEMYTKYPPKHIYVFRKRMDTFNNGRTTDDNGKKWSTTMCHACVIWEEGFKGEPIIRWM